LKPFYGIAAQNDALLGRFQDFMRKMLIAILHLAGIQASGGYLKFSGLPKVLGG